MGGNKGMRGTRGRGIAMRTSPWSGVMGTVETFGVLLVDWDWEVKTKG